jgi:hypothetical protein
MNRSKQPFSDGHFHPLQKIKCRDCGYTTKWYDMIERRSKALASGVGEGGSLVTPTLQETLFATGGRETQLVQDFSGTVLETVANTAAGTHDGSDVSYDEVTHTDDVGPTGAASGHMEVVYTMDTATFSGTIDFVRWVLRAIRVDISGTPIVSQISATTATAGFGVLSHPPTARALSTAMANYTIDATVDPSTGQPWTIAGINARKAGCQLDAVRTSAPGLGFEYQTRCAEFYLEIWGHE